MSDTVTAAADRTAETTCVVCHFGYWGPGNELNAKGICPDCERAHATCRSCHTPITADTSVPASEVNPSDPAGAYCLGCIAAGRFSRQEPECDEPVDFYDDQDLTR